ncbi:MAG: class I SAM-dependent methyltransferase [Acidobacteriaceae bacterium]|nr:class I SAM-dependent methyltransferase [Acidobacteriaceae bacterium]
MATLEENLKVWNDQYDWPSAGDEWSATFGGTDALWSFVLYPRIRRFLPCSGILEIAPGFGRWTRFLKDQCQSMIGVDISARCIEYCKARFALDSHIRFHVNDGTSLAAVPDNAIDFVFSFDSLVHAEKEVVEAYLVQIARKLTPDGVGFIHHSNIGAYPVRLKAVEYYNRLPSAMRRRIVTKENLSTLLSINLQAGRARSMTAVLFRDYCARAGLKCISQEVINWTKGKCLIDSVSLFVRPGSRWDRAPVLFDNRDFVAGSKLVSRLSNLYCS